MKRARHITAAERRAINDLGDEMYRREAWWRAFAKEWWYIGEWSRCGSLDDPPCWLHLSDWILAEYRKQDAQ